MKTLQKNIIFLVVGITMLLSGFAYLSEPSNRASEDTAGGTFKKYEYSVEEIMSDVAVRIGQPKEKLFIFVDSISPDMRTLLANVSINGLEEVRYETAKIGGSTYYNVLVFNMHDGANTTEVTNWIEDNMDYILKDQSVMFAYEAEFADPGASGLIGGSNVEIIAPMGTENGSYMVATIIRKTSDVSQEFFGIGKFSVPEGPVLQAKVINVTGTIISGNITEDANSSAQFDQLEGILNYTKIGNTSFIAKFDKDADISGIKEKLGGINISFAVRKTGIVDIPTKYIAQKKMVILLYPLNEAEFGEDVSEGDNISVLVQTASFVNEKGNSVDFPYSIVQV